MIIIGAGMSGLLAAHYFRHLEPIVLEQQHSLPNNHKALLRFRSEVVSELTGIPFDKVNVQKMIQFEGAQYTESNLMLGNLYSDKVSSKVSGRSINDLRDCTRYIAPDDFISKLSKTVDIKYNQHVEVFDHTVNDEVVISTMPVQLLAQHLSYDLSTLETKPIWAITMELEDVDVYQTIYYPCANQPVYRISITGNKVIAEFCEDISEHLDSSIEYIRSALRNHFGIKRDGDFDTSVHHQPYGKLVECDTREVKEFIGWATREHNIYSLGRWGTHRQVLMDDVVSDIKVIDKLIRNKGYIK